MEHSGFWSIVVQYFLSVLALFIGGFVVFALGIRRVTVLEYERAIKYTKGRFRTVLQAGHHWYLPYLTTIHKLDARVRFVSIPGQEVLSADGITIRISLAASFEIRDAAVAVNTVQNYADALYLELQSALRDIIGACDIDTILTKRGEFPTKLMANAGGKADALGLTLHSVNVKDIMFPGKLKETFAQVVNARQEGLAAMERARGETAALRSLANAARMLDSHPGLMQLRLMQTLGATSGNTVVVGSPDLTLVPATRKASVPKSGAGQATTPPDNPPSSE